MTSTGGWLFIPFMFLILALSLRTSSSLRCERGLGNCVDDETAISRQLKKRAKNCRFGCIGGGKRETDEKKPFKIPENEKQTADELIDEILQKRESDKKKKQKTPRPSSCARFFCGRKRSVEEPPQNEFNTANEVVTKRKPSALVECLRFGGCKRTPGKKAFSSPEKLEKSGMEHQEEQDSQPDCFGCKKREQTRLLVAPNKEKQESFPPVDQDDTQKPRCWRFGCGKRSTLLQTLVEIISKRFDQNPSQLKRFDQGDQ